MTMGNFKRFKFLWFEFGFEWWGDLRPENVTLVDGTVFKPVGLGFWRKQ